MFMFEWNVPIIHALRLESLQRLRCTSVCQWVRVNERVCQCEKLIFYLKRAKFNSIQLIFRFPSIYNGIYKMLQCVALSHRIIVLYTLLHVQKLAFNRTVTAHAHFERMTHLHIHVGALKLANIRRKHCLQTWCARCERVYQLQKLLTLHIECSRYVLRINGRICALVCAFSSALLLVKELKENFQLIT